MIKFKFAYCQIYIQWEKREQLSDKSSVNAIVINAETTYRIYEAVDKRKPLIDKDITVAGKLKGNLIQVFEDVPIGTRVGSLLDKAGAKAILISNCTDCTNTVMSCAPKLKLPVYHCTDGSLRAVNQKLIRKLKIC